MKTRKIIFLSIMSMLFFTTGHAQFLKKLKDKVKTRTEDRVTNKTADKAAETTDKKMDDIFSVFDKKDKDQEKSDSQEVESTSGSTNIPLPSASSARPRSAYHFSYLYQLTVEASNVQGSHPVDFLIEPNSDYGAMNMSTEQGNVLMVFDYLKKANFNFIAADNNKMVMAMDLTDAVDFEDAEEEDWFDSEEFSDYKVTDLPSKNFLGYTAKGKFIETDEWDLEVYYTEDIPVAMQNILGQTSKNEGSRANRAMENHLEGFGKGIVLYMKGTHKGDEKNNYTATCTKLEEINQTFSTEEYTPVGR